MGSSTPRGLLHSSKMDSWREKFGTRHDDDARPLPALKRARRPERGGGTGAAGVPPWGTHGPGVFFPGMAGHPCLILRATSLSLQGDPANIGKGRSRPARMPQEQTESGGIVLAAYAGPRAPRGGVTRKRRCTHRHSQSSKLKSQPLVRKAVRGFRFN